MEDKARAMVLGSFLGDSLALGVHWIYDANRIAERYGRVGSLLEPAENSHHAGKQAGEFTHYGDQTLVLLESAASKKDFDLSDFADRWRELFDGYSGYFDMATKATLKNFRDGAQPESAGSGSQELGGAARVAPLVYLYREEPEKLANAARLQTRMTHNNPVVVEGAAFFAETARKVLTGVETVEAIKGLVKKEFSHSPYPQWVETGLASAGEESTAALRRFGCACEISGAFPGVVHLVAKYRDDFREGMIANVMAGGDSAARGLTAGMLLAARGGLEALPEDWLERLKARERIESFLNRLGGQ